MFPIVAGLAMAVAGLTGLVLDPNGQPVSNATVLIVGLNSPPISTRTDEVGRFRVDNLPEGRFDITASSPGLIGEARGVRTTADSEVSVELTMRISAIAETLVVSAAQRDQPLSRVADTVTVIDGAEIETRQLSTIGEALASVPGMTVTRSGGPGTVTSLFPRGGESDFTLVLVDGIRVNAFGGGIDLSQVPLSDVDRIEVVRGPQSSVFGADAIGGIVQIITRRRGSPSASARVEAGSRKTRRAAGSTTGELNRWRWQAGADYFSDEGFTGVAPANGEPVSNDDARERQAWFGSGYRFTAGTDLDGVVQYVDTDRGAPGPYGADPAHTFGGVDRIARGTTERHAAGVRLTHPWGGASSRVRQRVEADVADFDLAFNDAYGLSEGETKRRHVRVQTDAVLQAGFDLSAGLEWLGEEASSTFITDGRSPVPVKRHVLGTFGELRWNAHERVSVQGGVRTEYIARQPLEGDGFFRPAFDESEVNSVNPKVAVAWVVSPRMPGEGAKAWTRLRVTAGSGIRPPDVFEIAFTDNPNLKPERSRSVEAGVTQALGGGVVTIDATWFDNRYDDLIIAVGSLSNVSRYITDNISNARARGLELSTAWRGGASTLVRAAYTLLDTEIRAIDSTTEAPAPFHVGDRLLRRPTHQGSVDVIWTRGRAAAFASLAARGVTLDAEPGSGAAGGLFENPGRTVVDAGASWSIVRGVSVYARVLNLVDTAYEEVLGYPAPRRTAFAGVRFAARR